MFLEEKSLREVRETDHIIANSILKMLRANCTENILLLSQRGFFSFTFFLHRV